jgi:hypothetical protein
MALAISSASGVSNVNMGPPTWTGIGTLRFEQEVTLPGMPTILDPIYRAKIVRKLLAAVVRKTIVK